MKESDCKVTDCGSRVQRVLVQSVDKVEKGTVTLNEEKSENACGDEDHDVERVPAIPKNPHHSEIHRRNVRDKLRVETDVRTITTKNTMSVMAKLMIACRCEDQESKHLLNNADMPRRFGRCGASSRVKMKWLEASQRTATQRFDRFGNTVKDDA